MELSFFTVIWYTSCGISLLFILGFIHHFMMSWFNIGTRNYIPIKKSMRASNHLTTLVSKIETSMCTVKFSDDKYYMTVMEEGSPDVSVIIDPRSVFFGCFIKGQEIKNEFVDVSLVFNEFPNSKSKRALKKILDTEPERNVPKKSSQRTVEL